MRRIIIPTVIRDSKINFWDTDLDGTPSPVREYRIYDPLHHHAHPNDRPITINTVECTPVEFWDKVISYTKIYLHLAIDDNREKLEREIKNRELIHLYRSTGILIHENP